METANRHVAKTRVGSLEVSTVFLGIDHNFLGQGKPLLFETMIFGGDDSIASDFCNRYSTWVEAEEGHKAAILVAEIIATIEKPR